MKLHQHYTLSDSSNSSEQCIPRNIRNSTRVQVRGGGVQHLPPVWYGLLSDVVIQIAYPILEDIGFEQRTDACHWDRVWKIQQRNASTEHLRILAGRVRNVKPVGRAQD